MSTSDNENQPRPPDAISRLVTAIELRLRDDAERLRHRLQTLVDECISPMPILSIDELVDMIEERLRTRRLEDDAAVDDATYSLRRLNALEDLAIADGQAVPYAITDPKSRMRELDRLMDTCGLDAEQIESKAYCLAAANEGAAIAAEQREAE